jgi:hypothetical protein
MLVTNWLAYRLPLQEHFWNIHLSAFGLGLVTSQNQRNIEEKANRHLDIGHSCGEKVRPGPNCVLSRWLPVQVHWRAVGILFSSPPLVFLLFPIHSFPANS